MSEQFYKEMWEDISVKKRAVTVNVINKKKDGTTYKCINRISPILNEAGEVKYFLGIQTIIN
jgi:PAS domain-containing protein